MREKKMSLTLQAKLKEAKKSGQLKKLTENIVSETRVSGGIVAANNISYQPVIDYVYTMLVLERKDFDINSQK